MTTAAESFITLLCAELNSYQGAKIVDPTQPRKICGWKIDQKTVIVSAWEAESKHSVCITYIYDFPLRHSTRHYPLDAPVGGLARRIKNFLNASAKRSAAATRQ